MKKIMPEKPGTLASIGLGGSAAVLTVNLVHPIETVKTRLQISGGSVTGIISGLLKNEGILGFWKGIQAAWGRESLYASIKIGGYGPIRDLYGASDKNAPFLLKFAAGATSGSLGGAAGNPFDVLKTKMQANAKQKVEISELARRLYKEQGIKGFYRGVEANVARACVLNATKMGCYDVSKGLVVDYTGWERKDVRCVSMSAFVAGFCMTCTVAPFDMVRTQLMNQPTNKKIYNGFGDCLMKIVRKNGPFSLWRGFLPIWARFAPTTTLQLLIFETLLRASGYQSI